MKVLDIDGLNYYDGKIKQTYATKTELNAKAPLASPTLTGTPTAPTPTAGDNSTKLATTAYVQGALSGATPTSIADTEIEQYWTGVTPEQVNLFLPLSGGAITGNLSVSGTITGNVTGTASGNLPLSGGTMSGSIELSGDWTHIGSTANTSMIIQHNKLTQGLELWGGSSSVAGASLILRGASNDDGKFYLCASQKTSDSDSSHSRVQLVGNPDGSLTWGGVSITDGTFLTVRNVNVTTRSGTLNYNISAPAVSGYQFLCWVMSATSGYVNYSYIVSAWNANTSFWMGNPSSGSVDCTAIYVRKW